MKSNNRIIEQILLLRCQIGDKEALAELIKRYQAPLRYFISRMSMSPEMAEDIFQETWLTVLKRINTLKNLDAFSVWLYRIARNKVYQQLRKKKMLSNLDENITAQNSSEDDVFSVEDAAKIHRCLKDLQPEHREVLMLRFLEQMPYQQISEVINCSLGTVKSRIHYAKLALKKEMEK
jgi:RNA polymerase sigma-70 factor (ECF subfamily)